MLKTIRSRSDLARAIREVGILPFFTNGVGGWSVEEHIDPALWFTEREGPWEWKGQLASDRTCVYGKFIRNKAAFISPAWFPDLANWRREGLTWEERCSEGLAPYREQLLMDWLAAHPYALARDVKRSVGFSKGFDTALTRLQMQTYVVTADFRYSLSKAGIPYGWGNGVIEQADRWLREDALRLPEDRSPEASFERIVSHLMSVMPWADETALRKELK